MCLEPTCPRLISLKQSLLLANLAIKPLLNTVQLILLQVKTLREKLLRLAGTLSRNLLLMMPAQEISMRPQAIEGYLEEIVMLLNTPCIPQISATTPPTKE